jgi:hypothetical protein
MHINSEFEVFAVVVMKGCILWDIDIQQTTQRYIHEEWTI